MKLDRESIERINTLHPKLVTSAMGAFNAIKKESIPLYVTWGSRTVEEQNTLYRIGRSTPGKVMTLKKGGYSPHNYGLALDFCLVFNGEDLMSWEDCQPREYWRKKWRKAISIFSDFGWESGWHTMYFQPEHVQNMLDFKMEDLIRSYEESKNRHNWRQSI
jgi:peptidoglycan L-alanyl-D-glutamate endopeptidase CwlK